MKRLFLFFSLVYLFSNILSAQDRTFDAGLVVGFNMSQIDGDALGGVWTGYNRIGVAAGGRVQFDFAEKWKMGFELLFSQLGSARNKYDGGSDYDKIRLNMVEVPVTISFMDWLSEGNDEDFYRVGFNGGLTYGRIINYEVILLTGEDVSERKDYNNNLLMLHLGFTYNINENFGITALWTKGLNDIDKDEGEYLISRQITLKGVYYF
ncbi:MAG: outer membrane beta-barrel protein [Saprospiraceae bacterium]